MKKLKIILYTLVCLTLLSSCDQGFEELNIDPNNSAIIPAHLPLGGTQRVFTNTIYGAQRGIDMGSGWGQHMSKVQYNDEMRYSPRRGVIDAIWSELYASVISEASAMYELAILEDNSSLQAAALIMQAIGYQTLVDLYGPVPYTEALNPNIIQPAYDSEAFVYEEIISKLTQAAQLLATNSGEIFATSDLYYAGDTSKWLKLANTLKFRALMRISSTRNVSAELQALANSGNLMTSNADSAQLPYLAAQPDANPIYETIGFGTRLEYKINSVLVETLQGLNDGRLAVYAAENESGIILGKPSGFGRETPLPNEGLGYTYANISGLGDFYLNPELPGVLMSYSQLNFLLAEAANEGLISGGIPMADAYYKTGILSSFEFNGLDGSAYAAQANIQFTTQVDARNKIALQEWISLYGQGFETWTEWRRTQLPALTPAEESIISQIPSRLYYPTTEQTLNNASYTAAVQLIGADNLEAPLFWQ